MVCLRSKRISLVRRLELRHGDDGIELGGAPSELPQHVRLSGRLSHAAGGRDQNSQQNKLNPFPMHKAMKLLPEVMQSSGFPWSRSFSAAAAGFRDADEALE